MICERGRRSVTRGLDAVGWLSFSVDETTASRSTSAQTHIRNTLVSHEHRDEERALWQSLRHHICISLADAPVSQTHQCHVTCQGQNLVSKPRPQTWGFHTWAGKPCNNIRLYTLRDIWDFCRKRVCVCVSVYWRKSGRSLRTPRGLGRRGGAWLWGEGFLGKDRWEGGFGDVSNLHLFTYTHKITQTLMDVQQ